MSPAGKWFNAASNAAVDVWKASAPIERRIALYVALALLGGCWLSRHDHTVRESGRSDIRDSIGAVTALRWHHAVDSAKAQIVHDTVSIARTIRHTDSLLVQVPETVTTPADTVRIVEAFPVLRAQYDTLKRSCMDLGLQAIRLGSACDSVQQALTRDRDGWKRRAEANKPKPWQRCGVNVGYGYAMGYAKPSPVVSLGCKVWP